MNVPMYEALDTQGFPIVRAAKIIAELPSPEDRRDALVEATAAIANRLGLEAVGHIKFGSPVFCAFKDMNRPRAKHHVSSKILLMQGCDVPLEFCKGFT